MTIFLILLACLVVLLLFLLAPAMRRHPDRKLLACRFIAHRGLHNEQYPENSLSAFQNAIDHGFAIETDIHLTKDGAVIVFHDDTFTRMCGVEKSPEDSTLDEIRALRLAGTDERIPTLQEFLQRVDGREPLLIEFKSLSFAQSEALCKAAAPLLDGYRGKYFVQAFHPAVLRWYKKHRKQVLRGQLSSGFYHEKGYKKLLGTLLINVLSRPDFVSYEHKNRRNVFFRLCVLLGALPVGWTFTAQAQIDASRKQYQTFIFEHFMPAKEN